MSHQHTNELVLRLVEDARQFAASGTTIISRISPYRDPTSLRAAAEQFRQAAKVLDQLDGVQQAARLLQIARV